MKTTYKGQTKLFDENGQIFEFDVINKKGDSLDKKGWRRVIMGDLMAAIEQIGNKKIKIMEYLIDNMDGKNQINKTYKQIEEDTKISYMTIVETFKALKECNLIKKYGGVYVLNCGVVSSYGNSANNGYLLIEYGFNDESIIKDKKDAKKGKLELENEQLKEELEQLKRLIPNVA